MRLVVCVIKVSSMLLFTICLQQNVKKVEVDEEEDEEDHPVSAKQPRFGTRLSVSSV